MARHIRTRLFSLHMSSGLLYTDQSNCFKPEAFLTIRLDKGDGYAYS